MMAMTMTSARLAVLSAGINVSRGLEKAWIDRFSGFSRDGGATASGLEASVIDVQPSVAEHEASRAFKLIHQGQIVGGDDDGRA